MGDKYLFIYNNKPSTVPLVRKINTSLKRHQYKNNIYKSFVYTKITNDSRFEQMPACSS